MVPMMVPNHHFVHEISQSIFDADDLTDNSTGVVPIIGVTTPTGLKARFLQRLSTITAANAKLHESQNQSGIEIHLTRNGGSPQVRLEKDDKLNAFIVGMEESLPTISKLKSGPACKQAEDELWDGVLVYSYSNIDHVFESLQRSFLKHKTTFDKLVSKMFGIDEQYADGSQLDCVLGDRLIELHQIVQSHDRSMRQFHVLVHLASTMTKTIEHLQQRLNSLLLNAKFGKDLYALILTLGFPERAFATFVRAAKTSQAFSFTKFHISATPPSSPPQKKVTFGASPTSSSKKVTPIPPKSVLKLSTARISSTLPSSAGNMAVRTPSPPSPPRPQRPATKHSGSNPGRTASQATPPSPSPLPSIPTNDIFAVVRPYLSEEDQAIGLLRLQPASKQDSAQLLGAVLRGKLLPKGTNAFHTFGFVTLRNESDERTLGGLYAAILQESTDPPSIFREIMQAVETHTLVDLIKRKEYSHILSQLPSSLSTFLAAPVAERPTVWHLMQFAADESSTSPPAYLQRDYGFKMCRLREEVQRLKDIYWDLLKTVDPIELHYACVHGRLYRFAKLRGSAIPKDERLMNNDSPAEHIGFENGKGLETYRGPFFRRG